MKSSGDLDPRLHFRIREVERQLRNKRWVLSWACFGGVTCLATCGVTILLALLSPDGLEAVVTLAAFAIVELIAAWYWLLRPLFVRTTLEQVALYIDEQHPELEDRIVSAVDFSARRDDLPSRWIVEQFLKQTAPIVARTSFKDVVDTGAVIRLGLAATSAMALSVAIIAAFSNLWIPSLSLVLPQRLAAYALLSFSVEPGDVRVRRGDHQMVWVRTEKAHQNVTLRWRIGDGAWEHTELNQSTSDTVFYHRFANIRTDIDYQAQVGRRRSPVYRISSWIPPEVDSIDLAYHYPEYVGRDVRHVSNGGNITAIEGTLVDLDVWVNKRIASAEMVLEDGPRILLEEESEALWTTHYRVDKNERYHIELVDLNDASSEYNPQYKITARRDRPPEIRIDFPRGDTEVSMLAEVPFDFKVTDDFGFSEYGIQYEVAGREPVQIPLNESGALIVDADGHYEIALEDLAVEPGDFITWTVFAKDTKPDREEFERLGDPYFLEIRPFLRQYQESVSDGGGMGGGMRGGEEAATQKEIIIATWNLRRDYPRIDGEEFEYRRDIIVEAQSGLRDKIKLANQLLSAPRPEVILLKDAMNKSVEALENAPWPNPKGSLSQAATHQQQAYRLILKLQPRLSQVQQGRGNGSGGQGSKRPDIQSLEMDRNRNFYENENLTREQEEATEEILNKIKELAQRQQVVNDELSKLISELESAKNEEERREIRRKLERLEDELRRNLERLDTVEQELASNSLGNEQTREALESLEQARRQMDRSLDQLGEDNLQQARSAGGRASRALGDIEEFLQQHSRAGAAQRLKELVDRMNGLKERQHEILDTAEALKEQHESPSMEGRDEVADATDQLLEDKARLSRDLVGVINEAGELSERARQSQELVARKLGDWLRETSKEGIVEDINDSQPLVQYGIWDNEVEEERKITQKIDDAAEKLAAIAGHLVQDDTEGLQKALEHLDNLLSEEGEGLAKGTEGAEDGSEPGEGGGAESSREQTQIAQEGQPSSTPAQGPGEDSGAPSESAPGSAPRSQSPGAWGGSQSGPLRPQDMRDFVQQGYRGWLEELRNAESLLPPQSPYRERVTRIREQVESLRRTWRERALAPKYDLYLEAVAGPLRETADAIQREIERRNGDEEFVLADEGAVPEKYKKRVADYFKVLSESEGKS